MLLRRSVGSSGSRRSVPRWGMGGLLLLLAALAISFPLSALARGVPGSVLGLSGPAAPAGAFSMVAPYAWVPAAVYPRTITRYAFTQVGEDLYVLGGVSDGTRVPDVNKYNATTNTWTPLAPIPVASEAPTAAYLNGKMYLAEGDTGDSFQIYDVATNTWSTGIPRPGYSNNYGAAAGAYNGKVYIVGGWNGVDGTTTTSIFNTTTASWSTGDPAPTAFFLSGYQTVGQYLYVVGGFHPGSPGSNINMTMRLDMSNGTWTTGPTFSPARADLAIANSGITLYAIGGDTNAGSY